MSCGCDCCRTVDNRISKLRVVSVEEDPASGGNKVFVTLEFPFEGADDIGDLDLLFHIDDVKRLVIKEASKAINRSAGWSDIGRLRFTKDGEFVSHSQAADAVRVTYTCLGAI